MTPKTDLIYSGLLSQQNTHRDRDGHARRQNRGPSLRNPRWQEEVEREDSQGREA